MSDKEWSLKANNPWAQKVIDSATKPNPIPEEEFWEQVKNYDPEEPVKGFDYYGNPLPGHNKAGYPIEGSAALEEPQRPYGGALPTANYGDLEPIKEALYDEAKGYIRQDPRFRHVRFDSSPGQRALTTSETLAREQSDQQRNWQMKERAQPQPEEEKPGLYQRAIWGMERGGAGFVQAISMQQSRGLADQIKYLEENPELQQQYADMMGSMYNLAWEQGAAPGGTMGNVHIDKDKYMAALKDKLQEYYTAQDIRRTAISGIPVSESLQKISEAETFGEAWEAFKGDWVGVLVEVTAESFPSMAPGIIAGAFGGPLAAAGMMGVSSYTVESQGDVEAAIMQIAQDIDADLSTTEGQQAVADDPRFAQLLHDAEVGGLIVGAFDTVAGLLPGINILGKNKPMREALLQTGMQMASGAGGEAGRQLYQEGEIKYPGRVGLEAAAEGPLGAVEVAASRFGMREEDTGTTPPERDVPAPADTGVIPMPDDEGPVGGEIPLQQELEGMSAAQREALNNQLDIPDTTPEQAEMPTDLPPQEGQAAPTPTTPVEPTPQAPAEAEPTVADQPTAEPIADIEAQLTELVDPESERLGVYLSPEQDLTGLTMDLGPDVVPIENFDGKGGTLIAKNEQVAMEATAARDSGMDMQQILGRLTGAGEGKPATGTVVQRKDAEGNVVQESAVADPAEAAALAEEWGEGAEILTPEQVLQRREDLIAEEQAAAEAPTEAEAAAAPEEAVTEEAAPEVKEIESPMIQAKEVEQGFRDLNKRIKGKGFPTIRKAVQDLSVAIAGIFPDAKNLPSMKGTIGAPAIGRYFEALDESIAIDETLPNLKEFLRAVVESPDQATAVQNINRLVDYVRNEAGGATVGTDVAQDVAGAAKAVGNYDAFEAAREASKQEYNYKNPKTGKTERRTRFSGPLNEIKRRAYELFDLATAVETLVGKVDPDSVPSGVSALIRRARNYREAVDKPTIRITKGGAGSVSKDVAVKGKNITEVSTKLRAAAAELLDQIKEQSQPVEQTAEQEAKAVVEPEKPKAEAKVEERSAVTEAPAKPKKPKKPKKPTLEQKTKERAKERAAKKEAKKAATETETRVQQGIERDLNSLVADAKKVEELGGIESYEGGREAYNLAGKITSGQLTTADMKNLSMADLRTIAKAVGAAAARSKDVIIDRINKAADAEVTRVEAEVDQIKKEAAEVLEQPATPAPSIPAPKVDSAVQENIDKLLGLIQQVKVWPTEKAAQSRINLAYHFRNVGDVVAQGLLKADVVNDLLNIFGAEKGADLKETRTNLMVATYQVVKADRAAKAETEAVRQEAGQVPEQETTPAPEVSARKVTDPKKVTDDPDEVDVEPAKLGVGREIAGILEDMGFGGLPLNEALKEANISKEAAEIVKGTLKKLDKKGQTLLRDALEKYAHTRDAMTLIASLAEALNGQPSEKVTLSWLKFGEGMADKYGTAAYDEIQERELLEQQAEELGYGSVEEMEEIEGGLGFDDGFDPKDYNYDEVRTLVDKLGDNPSPQDTRILNSLKNILIPLIENIVDAGSVIHRDKKNYGLIPEDAISMNDLLDLMIENMPPNNKYTQLMKKLRSLELDVPVHFFVTGEQLGRNSDNRTAGKFYWDEEVRGTELIGVVHNPDNVPNMVRTILHEMVHAATSLKYFVDDFFKSYVDELYGQALRRLPNNFLDPKWKYKAQAAIEEARQLGIDTQAAQKVIRNFLEDAADNANPDFMKYRPQTFVGLLTPREMIAESFANPNFQAWLAGEKLAPTTNLIKLRLQSKTRPAGNLVEAFMQAVTKIVLKYSGRNNILREIMFISAENFMSQSEYNSMFAHGGAIRSNQSAIAARISRAMRNEREDVDATDANMKLAANTVRKIINGKDQLTAKDAAFLKMVLDRDPRLAAAVASQIPVEAANEPINKPYDESRPIRDGNDLLDAHREQKLTIRQTIKKQIKEARNFGVRGMLALSGRDAIERDFRRIFDKAAKVAKIENPLTVLDRAFNLAQTMVRKYEKKAYAMVKEYSRLAGEGRVIAEALMRDITLANIDPTQPLNSAANAHIWRWKKKKDGTIDTTKPPKIKSEYEAVAIKARDDWKAFAKEHPKTAKLLKKMAALTKEIHDTKVRYAMTALGESYGFDEKLIESMSKITNEDQVDRVLIPEKSEDLQKKLDEAEDSLFPLTKDEKKELKDRIKDAEAREQAAKSAKTILRESSIKGWYFPLRRYGQYVVSTHPDVERKDKFVSFFDTQEEAELFVEKYNAKYAPNEEDNKVALSGKLEAASTRGDLVAVMSDVKKRIDDKDRDIGRIFDGAMAEVLNANAAYQSQLKRANIDGVAGQDMARAFEEYVHVSKYTLGDLRMSHTIASAISDINKIAKVPADYGLEGNEAINAWLVQKELKKQIKVRSGERKRNRISKAIGMGGFLNFLGAPSYWGLNATQTYVVTMPYFAAKYGEKRGPAELLKAQGLIFKTLYKTLTGGGEKSYEGFKANLPAPARKVVEQMESELLIQSTIAHEFGDILDPRGFKRMRKHAFTAPVGKVFEFGLMLMERIPEAIEHYNRISTGLAAYKLSDGNWFAVKDAVNETQMNYDTNNRARLLKALPGDESGYSTPYVTPVMMFKTFGIGMLKLFYGAAFKAAFEKGGRTESLKLAGYLMASHTIFGGVQGGLMIAPIAAIIWGVNQALEPDDEWSMTEAAEEFGRELAGDFGAVALERGLPAAMLGVDMSRSINLGNLLWMGNDRLEYEEYGDLYQALGSAFLGPMGSYGVNAVTEGVRLWNNDPRGGWVQFVKAAFPIKAVRAAIDAYQLEYEGLTTASELQLLSPEEFTGFLQTVLGFQHTQKVTVRNEYYDAQELEAKRNERRTELITWANRYINEGKWDKVDEVIEEMERFNASVPEWKYGITPGDIAMLRSRKRTAQREYYKEFGVEHNKYGYPVN